ncbi:MAG: uroporphyrinogen decarboxylase family protein, partial [Kiritimatiellae bacterium]|nr:uroporphyrinogen decarboxylase family protein [Kiritimatiellia bacterium]
MGMTHKQRAIVALTGGTPDYVPTFEMAFQLTEEAFGRSFHQGPEYDGLPEEDRLALCRDNAALYLEIARRYEHSIVMVAHAPSSIFPQRDMELVYTMRCIRAQALAAGEDYLLITHGDATFAIPEGDHLERMIAWLADEPERLHAEAEQLITHTCGRSLYYAEAGFDGFALCSDYAFNANPFFSPPRFAEYVAPYLRRILQAYRGMGKYTIKHTDGNIMPILDQIVNAGPHALHSLDPQGNMDIAEVKRLYGRRIALC